jgi:Abscisic acid G-protein coupled receptor
VRLSRFAKIEFDQKTSELIISNASLGFIGVLIITNIRGFSLTAHKFLRLFFQSFLSQFVSSEFTLLITAQIIGVGCLEQVYFLSTFFLLQLSMPKKYKHNLEHLLSNIDYFSIYRVFDVVLLISTFAWLVILRVNLASRHSKYSNYAAKSN